MSTQNTSFYLCTIPSTEGLSKPKFRNYSNRNTQNTCNAQGLWPITCVCNKTEPGKIISLPPKPLGQLITFLQCILAGSCLFYLPRVYYVAPTGKRLLISMHSYVAPAGSVTRQQGSPALIPLWSLTKSPRYQQLLCWMSPCHRNQLCFTRRDIRGRKLLSSRAFHTRVSQERLWSPALLAHKNSYNKYEIQSKSVLKGWETRAWKFLETKAGEDLS